VYAHCTTIFFFPKQKAESITASGSAMQKMQLISHLSPEGFNSPEKRGFV